MTGKRFEQVYGEMGLFRVKDNKTGKYYKAVLCGNPFTETDKPILDILNEIAEENEQLKSQLYCDDEEGVCNICKHHYLVKDDESELGYYNSRCRKGHYECARVSLKYCKDFEKELEE